MSTYKPPNPDRPIEELKAGDDFRQSVLTRSDDASNGGAPLWHGWVIMDAFLAGIDWARAQEQAKKE